MLLCAVAAMSSLVVPQARRLRSHRPGIALRACQSQLEEEPPFQVGQRVEGLFGATQLGGSFGCRWFAGGVTAARPDGSFDLQYDDGEREERVLPTYMRLLGAAASVAPPVSSADEAEPPWIVHLRARAAASSERRVRTLRQLAASIQPLETSLGTLGLSATPCDHMYPRLQPRANRLQPHMSSRWRPRWAHSGRARQRGCGWPARLWLAAASVNEPLPLSYRPKTFSR